MSDKNEKIDISKIRNLIPQIEEKLIQVKRAKARGSTPLPFKEKAMNVLYNHAEEIIDVLKDYTEIKEQYDVTVMALEDADDRISNLERRIKKLTENAAALAANKKEAVRPNDFQ